MMNQSDALSNPKELRMASVEMTSLIQRMFDALPALTALIGSDGTIKLVNAAWLRFARENGLKDPAKVSPGVNYLEICRRAMQEGEEAAKEGLEGIEAVLRGDLQEYSLEYPCHSHDEKRWYLMRVLPLEEENHVLIFHIDITQRKLAEDALRDSVEHYRILYEDNPTMYFTVDPQGLVLSVNRFGAEQLGYTLEELAGQSVLRVFHPEDREYVRKQFELCLKNPKQVIQWEFRKVRKDGSVIWVREAARAVPLKDGQEVILVVCENITDRKLFEQELKANEAKLERSNKELQDFAFIASHDLQEPLRKVRAFGSLLMEEHGGCLDGQGRDYLHRMMGATERMSEMIQSLLNYSRVATRAEVFQKVALTELVQEVVRDLESYIKKSGARVEVGKLPELKADRSQMERLFQNLIGNALKFHGQEAPLIRIRAEPDVDTGIKGIQVPQCRIFVEDNGIGFDEKYLDRIFTLFQRLHGRSEYEGAGMGLAICRKIVERHGGSITAKSKPGEGSTFIVTLPLEQPE